LRPTSRDYSENGENDETGEELIKGKTTSHDCMADFLTGPPQFS
jgi:hypothetical protein